MEQTEVDTGGSLGFSSGGNVLTEVVKCHFESLPVESARRFERIIHRLTGDKTARDGAGGRVLLRQRPEVGVGSETEQKRLKHQPSPA